MSSIFDIKGSQNVIVNHGNFYTTYANLSSTTIKRGATVKAGDLLGIVATNGEGAGELIFMVSSKTAKSYDPEKFLVKR